MTWRRPRSSALLLAAATAVAYLPVFGNGFVAYDDDLYVTECPSVRAGLDRDGVAWAFGSFHGANWFPLTRLSWMLDSTLFGVEPAAFHATSLLLHVANSLLLLLVLVRMTGAPGRSAFVAGVFALHPLHVESVAWAAARKDVLSGLFFLLGLLAHERLASRGATVARRAAVAVCMALGLLAKPILVAFPIALLLLDAWPLGRLRRKTLLPLLREKSELFALAAAAGVVTLLAQRAGGALQALDAIPLGERVANALVATVAILRRSFWPDGLAVFYPHPRDALPAWQVAAAAGLLLALTVLVLRAWPRRRYLAVGWLWTLALLAPVCGIVQVGGQATADRYAYLPLVGLAIAVAWGVFDLASSDRAQRALGAGALKALGAAALAALALLGIATFRQARTWRDTETLFANALDTTDHNAVAHVNLGLAVLRAGRLDEALRHAEAALDIAPDLAHAHALRAELRAEQGRPRDAIRGYEEALRRLPGTARWHAEIGRLQVEQGRVEDGVARLEEAARLDPSSAAVQAQLGRALERSGRHGDAIERYREALRLRPDLAELHGYLGAALLAHGETEAARPALERAALLQPNEDAWRERLGALHAERARRLEKVGRLRDAASAYREALRQGARDPRVLNNLAWILATSRNPVLRDPAAAVALAEEAAARGEPDAAILDTLSVAYAAAARPADARAAALRALARAEQDGDAALADDIRERLAEGP